MPKGPVEQELEDRVLSIHPHNQSTGMQVYVIH